MYMRIFTVETFVERLDNLLKLRNIKRQTICDDLEISRTSVSSWVSGKTSPSVHTIVKIAKYLDVSMEYLLTGETKDGLPQEIINMANKINKLDTIDTEIIKNTLDTMEKRYTK